MSSVFVSTQAEVVVVDSRTRSGTITLPLTNSIPYRTLQFKDQYGSFPNSTLTLSTQVGETFDDGTTIKTFSNAYSFVSLYAVNPKWMVMNATQTVQQTISSLTVNQLTFGTGAGWVQFGPVQATVVSSIQQNTQTAYINNLLIGNLSTVNAAQFYGLFGNYNNTVIAEISTGVGTQELLIFKGSSSSDRVRVQTTGSFIVEAGVSSRLWNSNTTATLSTATPSFLINTSGNVGIQTASPGATLDVAGTGRFITLSSQQLFVSSVNGSLLLQSVDLASTVRGLGSATYISSAQLISTTAGLTTFIQTFIDSPELTSTVIGLGSLGYTSSLNSTVAGLGSASYISSAQLISTTAGLTTFIQTFIDSPELTSTIVGLGSLGYVSSLNSTVQGLGTAGYISTSQLVSTTAGINAQRNAGLQSTIQGLGSAGYISSSQLISTVQGISIERNLNIQSTVAGLGTIGYISSSQLISTTAGINTQRNLDIQSTVQGLGQIYLSSLDAFFPSTVAGLGTAGYISTSQLVSTTAGINVQRNIDIQSTVAGLGTAGYVSTSLLRQNLISTVGGLGNIYISSLSNIPYISAQQIVASSIFAYIAGPTTLMLYDI